MEREPLRGHHIIKPSRLHSNKPVGGQRATAPSSCKQSYKLGVSAQSTHFAVCGAVRPRKGCNCRIIFCPGSPASGPNGEIFPEEISRRQSVSDPIMGQHTNHACPEPSARPSEKTNTSISTVPHLDKPPAKPRRHRDLHNEVYVFDPFDILGRFHTYENVATVMKVGRVAIITRGRYAGKKVRRSDSLPPPNIADENWKGFGRDSQEQEEEIHLSHRNCDIWRHDLGMEIQNSRFG